MLKNVTIEIAKLIYCSRLCQEPSWLCWLFSPHCQHLLLLSGQFILKQDMFFSLVLLFFYNILYKML